MIRARKELEQGGVGSEHPFKLSRINIDTIFYREKVERLIRVAALHPTRILAVGCIKATINHGRAEEWREVGI